MPMPEIKRPPLDGTGQLTPRHFQAIARAIEARVGIKLPLSKQTMVEGRLRRRLRALDLPTLAAYGEFLFEQGQLEREWKHLVDCVTTNKTDFFREPSHFDFLIREAAPSLLAGRRRRLLKVWSSASSIGAEAYTIAMVLADLMREGGLDDFAILGTDIATDVLEEARAGIYSSAMVAPVPPAMRQRYLMQSRSPGRDVVRIVPELRRRVRFDHLNLMDPEYPFDRDVDVIFCRNVLIYFDKPTQEVVVERLASHLRPGGFLMLGHSESMAGSGATSLVQVVPTVFQRPLLADRRAA